MTEAITFLFISIFAVELVLIVRELRRSLANTSLKALQQKLTDTEQTLDQAQRELQGIHILWNKSLQSEQKMRHDLGVAKIQLTYLAQALLKAKSPVGTSYWLETSKEIASQEEPATPTKQELRVFKETSTLAQQDLL